MAVFSKTLLAEDDAIISDALNHASIIDGVRLPGEALRYANNDMGSTGRGAEEGGKAAVSR